MIAPILIFLLTLLWVYALTQWNKSKIIASFIFVCCIIGIVFVVAPSLSTEVANMIGVGRGADLILYIISIISLAGIFNLHLKLRQAAELQTELVRKVALMSVQTPEKVSDN